MRAAVFLALVGCAVDPPPPVPTWEDAITAVAEAQCSRWIACGTLTDEDWQTCVRDLVWDTCQVLLDRGRSCLLPYPGDYGLVLDCADWYADVECRTYVPACRV